MGHLFLLLYTIPSFEKATVYLFIPGDRHLSCFHGQMSFPSPFLCYLNGSDYVAEAIRLLGWNNKIAGSKLSLASIFNRKYEYTFDQQAEGDSFNAEFCGRSACLPFVLTC